MHYADHLSLDDLARISGMSPTTFRRVFARIMQISPGAYVNTIRVNHARALLTTTAMKVLDITLACGLSPRPLRTLTQDVTAPGHLRDIGDIILRSMTSSRMSEHKTYMDFDPCHGQFVLFYAPFPADGPHGE